MSEDIKIPEGYFGFKITKDILICVRVDTPSEHIINAATQLSEQKPYSPISINYVRNFDSQRFFKILSEVNIPR